MKPRILVAGAGKVGKELARRLAVDWNVVLIDVNPLSEEGLAGVEFVKGDATSSLVLREAGVDEAVAGVAVTDSDPANLEFCRLLKVLHGIERLFTCLRGTVPDETLHELGVRVVSRPEALAAVLHSRVSEGKRTTSEVGLGLGEIVEVSVLPNSPVIGKSLLDLHPQSWLVAAIYRDQKLVVPHGSTRIQEADRVLLVGDPAILPSIANLFRAGDSEFPLQYGGYVIPEDQEVLAEAEYLVENSHALGCSNQSSDAGCLVLKPKLPGLLESWGLVAGELVRRVEKSSAPTLLARGSFPYDSILVAVSPGALREVELAIDVARVLGLKKVTALVVLPPTIVTGEDRIVQLRQALEGAVRLGEHYRVQVAPVALEGNPVRQIVQFARRFRLLVMGHRRPSRAGLLHPDVSRILLHLSPISTLVTCRER